MNELLNSILKEYSEIVNEKLNIFLEEQNNLQNNIYKSMKYSVDAGGKRLRPALTMEFAKINGGCIEKASTVAAAIECIHTYSLIHDDLPVMDNDDLRRGMPTNHKVFGEAVAILAGDGLLNMSSEIILKSDDFTSIEKVDILEQIFTFSGVNGMIGGQVVDMEYENKKADLDTLNYIYELKTGALFEACCISGCIIGGDYSKIPNAKAFAKYLGLAFQITDDILDVVGDSVALGKNINSDVSSNKSTYVSLLGVDKAKEKALEYINKAKKQLENFEKSEFLLELCDMILTRKV